MNKKVKVGELLNLYKGSEFYSFKLISNKTKKELDIIPQITGLPDQNEYLDVLGFKIEYDLLDSTNTIIIMINEKEYLERKKQVLDILKK